MDPEDIKVMITQAVEQAVDTKINGKLLSIKAQLTAQDIVLTELKVLLEDKDFLSKLWKLIKSIFTGIVALGSAWLLYKQLHQ